MDSHSSWLILLSFGDRGWSDSLLWGAGLSLSLSVTAYLLGLVLGLMGAAAKISGNRIARAIANFYTSVIRSVPEILIIFLVYYTATNAVTSLLQMTGLVADFEVNGFVAATFSLGIVQGGYSTEVLRGALVSVARGQSEAGYALGLTPRQNFRLIVLPQAIPLALPGLGNLWLIVLKETSLVSLVGFTDLVLAGKMAAGATHRYFLFYSAVAVIFLVMSGVSTVLLHMLEERYSKAWRQR